MQEAPHIRKEKTRNNLGVTREVNKRITGVQRGFEEVVSLDVTGHYQHLRL